MCVWQWYWKNYQNEMMEFWTKNRLHWLRYPSNFLHFGALRDWPPPVHINAIKRKRCREKEKE